MALLKADREKCWAARDLLWKCMDEKQEKHQELCKEFRQQYEKSCPSQWVKHFDRKREYLKFKEQIANEGADSTNKANNGYLAATFKTSISDESLGSSSLLLPPPNPLTQPSRSTSSVPGELSGNLNYVAEGLAGQDDATATRHPSSRLRILRKFPSLPSI